MVNNYYGNLFMCGVIALLFAILIFVISISFKNATLYKKHLLSRKWLWPIADVLFGMVLSTIYFFIFFLVSTGDPNNAVNAIMVILIILPGVLYTSPYFGLGGVVTLCIGIFKMFQLSTDQQIYIVVNYLIYLSANFIVFYVFHKMSKIVQSICVHGFFAFVQILFLIIINYAIDVQPVTVHKYLWVAFVILQVFILIIWLFMNYINKIYEKSQTLNVQTAHDYKYFVTADYAQYAIDEFINTYNVQYAYVIGFSIKNIKKDVFTVGDRTINDLKQNIADDIFKFFSKFNEKIFFMTQDGFFFVLVKTNNEITKTLDESYGGNFLSKRKTNDLLKSLESFKFSKYNIHDIYLNPDINLMVGFYGVHDNSITQIVDNLENMIRRFEPKKEYNAVQLFNPQTEFVFYYDMEQFQQLKQILNISLINVSFSYLNYQDEKIAVPMFSLTKLAAFNMSSLTHLVPFNLHSILIKHLAARAIQQFSTNQKLSESLMINYPIETLTNTNFSSQSFDSKISYFSLTPKQIILLLDLSHLPSGHNMHTVVTNIMNLKKYGFRIVCKNVKSNNIDFVNQIKPYFIFYNEINKNIPGHDEYNKLMVKLLAKIKVNYYTE